MATLKFPERLLQPFKSLRQFQQELYAMHKEGGGTPEPFRPLAVTDDDGPEQAAYKGAYNAVGAGASARDAVTSGLALSRSRAPAAEGFTPPPVSGTARKSSSHAVSPRLASETRVVTERRREAGQVPVLAAPAFDPIDTPDLPPPVARRTREAEPARRGRPDRRTPDVPDSYTGPGLGAGRPEEYRPGPREKTKRVDTDFTEPDLIRTRIPFVPGGGGGQDLIGKVTAADSLKATVDLYENGPDADATQEGVTVKLPTLNESERMNVGDWIYGIYIFPGPPDEFGGSGGSAYYAQPPTWVA